MDRVILLIDMNAYFASVEQVSNPALRGKPIVVCGRGRTVVTTASYEAREYGIKTGMTLPEAKWLCPAVIPVHGDMDKYVHTSLRIHKILLEFTDRVEAFSIDECFLDITPLCRSEADPQMIARRIKERFKKELQLRCSIGIGPNKLIAKLASKLQKPDGLVEVKRGDIPALFARLSVEEMQGVGIGRKLAPRLRSLGIETARQLGEAPISLLTAHFGMPGYHLKDMGKGEDNSPVQRYGEQSREKSIGHSHTLPRDTRDGAVIASYLLMLSEKVGVRLREAKLVGKTVTLAVRYSDFHTISRQKSLARYIKTGQEIYAAACGILRLLMPLSQAVRLLGVSIHTLVPDDCQRFLLDDLEKQQRLVDAVDGINKKYGAFTVKPSSLLVSEKFGISEGCGMMGKYWMNLQKPAEK